MRLYADQAAYEAAYGTAPANIDLLLRNASRTIDSLLVGKVYDTDATTGLPTAPDDAQAMQDAACAIAAELDATGALKAGQSTAYATVAIGNVNLSGPTTATGALIVDGIPVPTAALTALAGVGRTVVYTSVGGYVRPLDRVAL